MKQKLQTLFDKNNIKLTVLNSAYILFLIALFLKLIVEIFQTYSYESWEGSEWLINYQGGYVRRGLIGEILFFFAKYFNINIAWALKIFALICLFSVAVFFVRSFLKQGYSLYILPLSFFMGTHIINSMFWQKRDHLMFLFLIATFWAFTKINKGYVKILIVNVLLIIAFQVHEVLAFFSLPILYLLFFNEYRNKGIFQSIALSFIFLLPGIFSFLLTLRYHGDLEIAQAIWDSWVAVSNMEAAELTEYSHSAVSALGWTSEWAFKYHFESNFLSTDMRISSFVFWSMTFLLVYYIVTNALLVFRKKENIFTNHDKNILSSVLIFQLICLTPVFLVLSCDLGRVIFYWVASSFVIFLLIPKSKIERLFPLFFLKFIEKINNIFINIISPTKTTLVLLMMFIGVPTAGFRFSVVITSSAIYNILLTLSAPLHFFNEFIF